MNIYTILFIVAQQKNIDIAKQIWKQVCKAELISGSFSGFMKDITEMRQYIFRLFFQAGGIPDYAKSSYDFETLTG